MKRWRWLRIHDRETPLPQLIRILNERLKALGDFLGGGSEAAAEFYLYNDGATIVAGESDWLLIPFDFTLTSPAESVLSAIGDLEAEVWVSTYATWPSWTKISASAPVSVVTADKSRTTLTGWTDAFAGGTYMKLVVLSASVTKATVTLPLGGTL